MSRCHDSLRSNAISEIAGNFSSIEQAVVSNKLFFGQGPPSDTRIFVLDASDAKARLQRADFYCGIYNSADRVGFSIPNEFVVGYGLDYSERYRNLPYVGVLSLSPAAKKEAKQK